MTRPNLEAAARDCIADAVFGMETLDMGALRGGAEDMARSAADNACIYNGDCLEIISRYGRDAPGAEGMTGGDTYKAADWQQAMTAYAYAVAYSVISRNVRSLLEEIEQAADDLRDAAEAHGLEGPADPRISANCPRGWAARDREDAEGACFWAGGNLEGCRAVARKVAGIWLSYAWAPEKGGGE